MLTFEQVAAPSDVYRWLDGRPAGVLAELPATEEQEAVYTYLSTVHWQRILNGYSGVVPASYAEFRRLMVTFPDDPSMQFLHRSGVDYVVVHEEFYGRAAYQRVITAISNRAGLQERARAVTGGYEARIYQLAR